MRSARQYRLAAVGVSPNTILALDLLHYALGSVDAIVFLANICIMGWRAIEEMLK
jgi:hypothetical protein